MSGFVEDRTNRRHLPKMPLGQEVMTDYSTIGLSLKKHPVALIREELKREEHHHVERVARASAGKWTKVAGLVLIRQRPGTASGIVFVTLEDETGMVNLIVRPDIYEKYRPGGAARGTAAGGWLRRAAGAGDSHHGEADVRPDSMLADIICARGIFINRRCTQMDADEEKMFVHECDTE